MKELQDQLSDHFHFKMSVAWCALLMLCSGCGGPKGPALANVSGIVHYQGKPLEGASVVFIPDNGPVAYGSTDVNGAFSFSTQGRPGAMVGHGKIAVTAYKQVGETKPEHEMTTEEINNMYKPLIPNKYGRPETSNLEATVQAQQENQLTLDLN